MEKNKRLLENDKKKEIFTRFLFNRLYDSFQVFYSGSGYVVEKIYCLSNV